jgi:hypothetical protein
VTTFQKNTLVTLRRIAGDITKENILNPPKNYQCTKENTVKFAADR